MPILMKKVLKLWCENIQEGGLQLFQGLRLFPSLEIVDKPKLKELGGDQKLVDISVIAIKKLSQGPKEVIFVGTKKRYVCNTNFSSNQDQKKKLFLMSSQASPFFCFLTILQKEQVCFCQVIAHYFCNAYCLEAWYYSCFLQ